MKTPVLFAQGAPMRVEDLSLEPPRQGEVRVRGATVPLDLRPIVGDARTIRGSSHGGARTREDFPRLVALDPAGTLPRDPLVTRRDALDEANEAFRDLAAGAPARGPIVS
jgi:Zn-dependent alcohol dehydrogenase